MSETKHTLVSYDVGGPSFGMLEPACDSEAYLKDAERKLAEHPHLVAELAIERAVNADMLAALEAAKLGLEHAMRVCAARDMDGTEQALRNRYNEIVAAIAKAKVGAK